MNARLTFTLAATLVLPVQAASLEDAFTQGSAFGRTGNAAARPQLTDDTVRATVPNFNANPPEASYFGSAGLGTPAAARVGDCAGAAAAHDPACRATAFSQTNRSRRPTFTIAPTDPLLARARTITADPQSIAGNIAGTYSACTTQTLTQPDRFETLTCHQYRTAEPVTCQKLRSVEVRWADSCPVGTWFAHTWVNTWGNGEVGVRYAGVAVHAYCRAGDTIRLRVNAICTEAPCEGEAELDLEASTGTPGPQTFTNFIGRSWFTTDVFNRVDYRGGGCTAEQCRFEFCTRYEDSETYCDDPPEGCNTEWIDEQRACGTFAFDRPRSIPTVTDAWDNQCAAFEARLP